MGNRVTREVAEFRRSPEAVSKRTAQAIKDALIKAIGE
jgi:hypothetical protein